MKAAARPAYSARHPSVQHSAASIQFLARRRRHQLYYTSAATPTSSGAATATLSGNGGDHGAILRHRQQHAPKPIGRPASKWTRWSFDVLPGPNSDDQRASLSIQAIIQGVFDGAELTVLARLLAATELTGQSPIVPTDAVVIFVGRVAEIDAGRSDGHVQRQQSPQELLNQNMPRNLYQSGCLNTLFDSACTLNAASLRRERHGGLTGKHGRAR